MNEATKQPQSIHYILYNQRRYRLYHPPISSKLPLSEFTFPIGNTLHKKNRNSFKLFIERFKRDKALDLVAISISGTRNKTTEADVLLDSSQFQTLTIQRRSTLHKVSRAQFEFSPRDQSCNQTLGLFSTTNHSTGIKSKRYIYSLVFQTPSNCQIDQLRALQGR